MREAIVRNHQGRAYFRAINITNGDQEIVVPTLELQNFKIRKDQGDIQLNALGATREEAIARIRAITTDRRNHHKDGLGERDKKSRAKKVESLLQLDHLNDEEKRSVVKLLTTSVDCFQLTGEQLGSTQVLSHKIIIIDEAPTNVK